jgi:hypothetical protein
MAAEADSQAPPSETGTINITSLVEARVAVAPTR